MLRRKSITPVQLHHQSPGTDNNVTGYGRGGGQTKLTMDVTMVSNLLTVSMAVCMYLRI